MKPHIYPGIYLCAGVALVRVMSNIPLELSIPTRYDANSDADAPTVGEGRREEEGRRTAKLADGCRHVFLDVGSNIGVHARMLLEPHLYPANYTKSQRAAALQQRRRRRSDRGGDGGRDGERGAARDFFVSQFGPESDRDPSDFCVFAFEPNPAHVERHREMEGAYAAVGWRYHFVHAGASDEDGMMTFYHVGRGDRTLERGFSTNGGKCGPRRDGNGKTRIVDCTEEAVKVVRLSSWIDREVHGRIIPEDMMEGRTRRTSSKEKKKKKKKKTTTTILPPRVVMKMDIETSEFLVLPDLLTSGVLCRDVDALIGEFHTASHSGDYPISFPRRGGGGGEEDGGGAWTLDTPADADRLKDEMIGLVRRNPNCKTEIVIGDDETYERDGMPWPV